MSKFSATDFQHKIFAMSNKIPVVTIQCDWNEILRLPNCEAWISSKYLNESSLHDKLRSTVNSADGKIKLLFSDNYHYVSHSSLNLVVRHVQSGLKVAFVAASKVHCVHNKAVLSVSAAENALVVSSCEADKLLVWDSRTNEILLDLKGHGGPVYKCRFFPSGVVVLSAGADGSCRIWSAETGNNPVILKGHTMSVADVCIIEKGRNVVTVSKDGTAKLWDVGNSNCLANIIEGQGAINSCVLTITENTITVDNEREIGTDNKILVVGCENGLVICTQMANRKQIFAKQLDSACNSSVVINDTAIIGCANGKIVQLNIQDGSLVREWHESASPILSMAVLPNDMFVVGRQDGSCTVISLNETHSLIRVQLTGSDCDGIRDISFNGKWVFVACRDSYIRKYDYNQINVHYK